MSLKIENLRVSTKLMLVNAAILIIILVLTSLLTIAGLYFSVYHQAEVELEHSILEVRRSMERSESMSDAELPEPLPPEAKEWALRQNPDWVPPPPFLRLLYREGVLTPGVVLRVLDADGRKIFGRRKAEMRMRQKEYVFRKIFPHGAFIACAINIRQEIIDAGKSAAPHVPDSANLNRCRPVSEYGQTIVFGMDAEFHEDIYLIFPNEVRRVFVRGCTEFFRCRVFGCVCGVTVNLESRLVVMRKQRQHQFSHWMTAKICRKVADAKPVMREPALWKRNDGSEQFLVTMI